MAWIDDVMELIRRRGGGPRETAKVPVPLNTGLVVDNVVAVQKAIQDPTRVVPPNTTRRRGGGPRETTKPTEVPVPLNTGPVVDNVVEVQKAIQDPTRVVPPNTTRRRVITPDTTRRRVIPPKVMEVIINNNTPPIPRAIDQVLASVSKGDNGPAEQGIAKGFDWGKLFQIMQRMPGNEQAAGFSANLPTAIAQSGLQVDEARAIQAAEEQERMLEVAKLGAKQQEMPTLSGEHRKVIDQYYHGVRGTELLNKMKGIMLGGITSGVLSSAIGGLTAMGTALGITVDSTKSQDIEYLASLVKTAMAESGVLGRETSKTEFNELVNKLVATPGIFSSEAKITKAMEKLNELFKSQTRQAWGIAKSYGIPLDKIIDYSATQPHIKNIERGTQ